MREIVSGKGSRFLQCTRAESDTRYKKYPPLPVTDCSGYEQTKRQPSAGLGGRRLSYE